MGLVPLKLVAALKPADRQQSTAKATPAPSRAPAKLVSQGSSSTSATSFRSIRKILHVKAPNSAFLPYGNDEWRSLLDDVKDLFRNGRYKECSDRCVAALEQVRGPVSWPAMSVNASCIARLEELLFPIMASYQISLIVAPKIHVIACRKRG